MATINLGPEHNSALHAAVLRALEALGARRRRRWWGLGGSQEIDRSEFVLDGRTLVLESETYVGLTLSGPEHLVARLLAKVADG